MEVEFFVLSSACVQGFFLVNRQEQAHPNAPEFHGSVGCSRYGSSFMRTNPNKVIAQNEVPVFDPTSHRFTSCLQCNGRFVSTKQFGGHEKYGSEIFSDAPSTSLKTNPDSTYNVERPNLATPYPRGMDQQARPDDVGDNIATGWIKAL